MASKSRIPAVGITLVLCALASCARDGPTLEQAPPAEARHDTVACGEEEEMSEEEVAAFVEEVEQIGPERLEATMEEWKPVAEALSEYFGELTEQTARPGAPAETSDERYGTFAAFQTDASTVPQFLGALEDSGHDMSLERSCGDLVPAKLVIEPDCRPTWYFFCWRDPALELISTYRPDTTGWVKTDTP